MIEDHFYSLIGWNLKPIFANKKGWIEYAHTIKKILIKQNKIKIAHAFDCTAFCARTRTHLCTHLCGICVAYIFLMNRRKMVYNVRIRNRGVLHCIWRILAIALTACLLASLLAYIIFQHKRCLLFFFWKQKAYMLVHLVSAIPMLTD